MISPPIPAEAALSISRKLALDLASRTLKKDGVFLARVFQREGFDVYLKDLKSQFKTVVTRNRMPHGQDPERFFFSRADLKAKPWSDG